STAAPLLKQTYQSTTAQNFVQEVAKVSDEQHAKPILASFTFERTGSEIRIIDQDGSLYLGSLGPSQNQLRVKAARRDQLLSTDSAGAIIATKKASQPPPPASPEEYTFHVTGTNRTLGKLVSFDGRWSTLTNVVPLPQSSKDLNRGIGLDSQVSAAPTVAGRISGMATIKGGTAIPISAVSTTP